MAKKSAKKEAATVQNHSVVVNLSGEAHAQLKALCDLVGGKQRTIMGRLVEWYCQLSPEDQWAIIRGGKVQVKQADQSRVA
jgi:hypothetical protein